MDFTFDDLLQEMRDAGEITPEKEDAARLIKQKARALLEEYGDRLNAALGDRGEK